MQKVDDPLWGFPGDQFCDAHISDTGSGGKAVLGVREPAIVRPDRRRNAALSPNAGTRVATLARGDHQSGERRKLEGREKSGNPGTENNSARNFNSVVGGAHAAFRRPACSAVPRTP